MLELILLRHAEALPAGPGDDDRVRRLSGHGEQEARALIEKLGPEVARRPLRW